MPTEAPKIDINDPILQAEMIEADAEAEFFELPPPPPDDRDYQVKILLGERGVVVKRQSRKGDPVNAPSGPIFLSYSLELRVIDPDQSWHDAPLFDNATSIVMQRTGSQIGTSRLHAILRAVGAPALGKMSLDQLREHASGVFAGEPLCWISGKWEASSKQADGSYKTILKGMRNFPLQSLENPELGHYPYAEDPDTHEAIRAQFRVNRYFAEPAS